MLTTTTCAIARRQFFNHNGKLRAGSLATALILALSPAHAARFGDEIVVTATKSPLKLSETGASITVIDAREIETRQYQFAADALADATGLAIARNGAFGGQAALRIRGESSGRTLVLIDGVVVNDPSAPGGGFNFASLDVTDIERIEILRGPQSILYGSEAIGGVVSITTKRGGRAPTIQAHAEGGSFGTFHGGAGLAGASGGADYALSAFGLTSDGVSRFDGGAEADGIDSYGASARFGAALAGNLRLEVSFRYSDAETDFDGFPPPNFTLADTADKDRAKELIAAGRTIATFFDGAVENIITLGYHKIDRESTLGDIVTFDSQGDRLSAEYLALFRLSERITVVAGGETETTHIDSGGVDDDVTVNSAFGLVAVKPLANLTLTAGGRHDDHETFGGASTARATAAYTIESAGLTLRGSWGEGFAAPSLFQLNFVCCGGAAPNRTLQPETSEGWEIGFDKSLGDAVSIRATYFQQRTEQQIDFDFLTGAYVNLDETHRHGVETEIALRPLDSVDLSIAYAFIDGENTATSAPLLRQPKHAVTLSSDWRVTDRLSLGSTVRYNGEETDTTGIIDSNVRVDFRASLAATDKLEVYGRVENAFDADYQDVLGYGEPGVAAFGGVRVRL